ncbi:glycoside hydrolase family 43 protein [Lewinella sp. JB7]|uniref:glycoside hydrolase family 43 protein n=1 Tax=Lewinella sp. JB7 TaxID=2962887 RepID=UPI0020C94EF8|nr:glycoside hydrolase family 43 protein [Lewinella sp. JB7]MCP9236587.1 glycoside hydrolase family 43 protein [Lewinella sp. JB7]
MHRYSIHIFATIICGLVACTSTNPPGTQASATSGNPIFPGWYADPEVLVADKEYWIFPTTSAAYTDQLYLDAFSSPDLVHWTKHERILDTSVVTWVRQALWAPSVIEKDGRYYLFFGGNDVQRPSRDGFDPDNDINHYGGIGVAVADAPGGPYTDHLGKPLIDTFYHDAQPIDQFVFRDTDGTDYFFYGGWGKCNLGVLNDTYTGFLPWPDGQLFHDVTPEGYVEGPFMFRRNGTYYFMWSEGGWTNDSYRVAYAMARSPTGPFERIGTILSQDPDIATGAGHHSVVNTPGTDDWYIVYHRRPIPNEGRDHRVTCIDRMEFNADGTIRPVVMTREGVAGNRIR